MLRSQRFGLVDRAQKSRGLSALYTRRLRRLCVFAVGLRRFAFVVFVERLWEGRVVVIPVFKVLQFDDLAEFW